MEIDAASLNHSQRKVEPLNASTLTRCLLGTPFILGLGYLLKKGTISLVEVWIFWVTIALSMLTIVLGAINFDYHTSNFIKQRYKAEPFRFPALHFLFRLCEISGRYLVLIGYGLHFHEHLTVVVPFAAMDFALGVAAVYRTGRGAQEIRGGIGVFSLMLIALTVFVYDVSRYVDEVGMVLPARLLSRYLSALRALELAAAIALLLPTWTREWRFLACMLLCFGVHGCLRACCSVGQRGHDIFSASCAGDVEALRDLIASRADLQLTTRDTAQRSALHLAVACGHNECARRLLEGGADPNDVDAELQAPLHLACSRADLAMVELLVHAGEPPGAAAVQKNSKGLLPRDILPQTALPRLFQLLRDAEDAVLSWEDSRTPPTTRILSATHGPAMQNVDEHDLESLFGPVVGAEHTHLLAGIGLPSFVLNKGLGAQQHRILQDLRERAAGHQIRLTSLKKLDVLGSGGFGTVVKVQDTSTGNLYAMKLQRKDRTTKQAIREARALHTCSHPFIVRIHHIFQTEQFCCLVMELCDRDLNMCILGHRSLDTGRAEGLPDVQVAAYTVCLMQALEFLHLRLIIFRDLKPENVLTSGAGQAWGGRLGCAKLADFGLARSVRSAMGDDGPAATAQFSTAGPPQMAWMADFHRFASPGPVLSTMAGTRGFMAQEALLGVPSTLSGPKEKFCWLSSRDWYGLGCCLMLMLLGETGGRAVRACGRTVLMPPPEEQIFGVLAAAQKDARINRHAFNLAVALTASSVADRAGPEELRKSPYLQDAFETVGQLLEAMRLEEEAARQSPGTPDLDRGLADLVGRWWGKWRGKCTA